MNYVKSRAGAYTLSARDSPESFLDAGDNMIAYIYPWELIRGDYCHH
ncbi:hypothetical protein [Methanospirillum lacunae]|nr:hypothetical protein [Methanospirillum lacunae]